MHAIRLSLILVFASSFGVAQDDYESAVVPFFEKHCTRCHGPEKSKAKIRLDTIRGDFSRGSNLETWETILEVLEHGEMPPEDEPQPDEGSRQAVALWIESGLRDFAANESRPAAAATARRLTNFEYENTMRDLLGFRLNLIDNLPEDPAKPYHFNNTAEFMLIGPEQLDRYKENARRAMESAIVDPGEPEVFRTSREFKPLDPPERGMQYDEIGIYGNRRNTAAWGMGLKSWPESGEFRIRIQAAAILPEGFEEVPLRLIMGQSIQVNSASRQVEEVGVVHLRNRVDDPQIFEFRGRIENHPFLPGRSTNRGEVKASMSITPQNLFDDGRLNDRLDPLAMPRAVVQLIEFEAPVTDVWPPEHHTRILFDSPLRESDPGAYLRQILERFISRAFRRPATEAELERFVRIHSIFANEFETLEEALRETLTMVLISPQFLYHTREEDGVATRQFELASRLSYFLWGSMPDQQLLELATDGKLDDPAILDEQTRRLLADPRSRDFVDNFTTQWLSIAKSKAVKINTSRFPRFLYLVSAGERRGTEVPYRPTIRDHMHEESVGFIAELIRRNASVLNVVDSDFAWLNQPLAVHYGIEGVQGLQFRAVAIQPEHRLGGLLTHGSVLVGNATGSAPHPIYRAVWLREAILGDEVKPPPADVPALEETAGEAAANAATIKDALRLHRQKESCNDCHVRLDPWGIPFERYNAIGRFQPKIPPDDVRVRGFNPAEDNDLADYAAYLESINTVEIQADARVPRGPEIDGMTELKAHLLEARSDEIVENVIRRLLTYAIGRELTFDDRFEVQQLLAQAKKNGYGFQDLIVSICQSSTFRGLQTQTD